MQFREMCFYKTIPREAFAAQESLIAVASKLFVVRNSDFETLRHDHEMERWSIEEERRGFEKGGKDN